MPHEILTAKLEIIGFDSHALKWIKSYLSDRKQQVEVDTFSSQRMELEPCSVIQGSIASCILYQIFTADLPLAVHQHPLQSASQEETCSFPQVGTYVDDIYLVPQADTQIQLNESSQLPVENVDIYMKANRLQLNVPKTACMATPPNISVTIQTALQPVAYWIPSHN